MQPTVAEVNRTVMQHPAATDNSGLSVGLARNEQEILAAKKLRWQVFAEEGGAQLNSRYPGVDHDFVDPYCQHLVVRQEETGEVVGTYRILTPESAQRLGAYYSEELFDLTRLSHLRPYLVEVGRACVRADYRSGGAISMLWAGLARFLLAGNYRYLFGSASISLADGGCVATGLRRRLTEHLAPEEYRVIPRSLPIAFEHDPSAALASPPPLLRAYLRAGAWICGEPAWDPDFNTADFPVLLSLEKMNARFMRHYGLTPTEAAA